MLLITRRVGEKIMVGDDVVVHVMEIVGNTVRVGIQAPRSVPVYREEIWDAVRDENRAAADAAPFELPRPAKQVPLEGVAAGERSGYGLGMDFAKTARNLAVADIALAFARDRVARMVPGIEPKKKRSKAKTFLIGGGIAAALAALLFKRDAVRGLLPGGETESAPAEPDATPRRRFRTTTPPVRLRTPRPPCPSRPRSRTGDRRGRRGGRRRGRGRQHRRRRLRLRRSRGRDRQRRARVRWSRPARARPRARSRPRPNCARPPSRRGHEPGGGPDRRRDRAGRQPRRGRAVEPVKPPRDGDEWQTWSGRSVEP